MTFQQLLYFCEIAKTLNYTKASERLYVSQSSLSHAMLALERELQASLFIRNTGKSVALTRFGNKLLPYAQKVLEDVRLIERLAKDERNPLSGVVNIAYSFINGFVVLNMFEPFLRNTANQNITLSFDVTHNTRPTESRLLEGEIDIAFNCNTGIDGIETVPIARQPLYVLVPVNNPLAERNSLRIEDIADEPLIYYHPVSELHKRIVRMFANAGIVPNEVACYDEWSSQVASVSLGLGIGISPRLPVDTPRIKLVPLDDPLAVRTIYMLWAANREQSAVIEYVKSYCMHLAENGGTALQAPEQIKEETP